MSPRRILGHTKYGPSKTTGQENLETNPIPIKLDTASQSQKFWLPLPCRSLPVCPFPIKSFVLSAHVSPQTIHFQVLDKNQFSGPLCPLVKPLNMWIKLCINFLLTAGTGHMEDTRLKTESELQLLVYTTATAM